MKAGRSGRKKQSKGETGRELNLEKPQQLVQEVEDQNRGAYLLNYTLGNYSLSSALVGFLTKIKDMRGV